MIYSVNFLDMTEQLSPPAVVRYVKETGWTSWPTKKENIRIFQINQQDNFYQIIIPLDKELADYREVMYLAVNTIAEYEKKPLEEVFLYLLNPNTDILKIRVNHLNIEPGSILMDDAISLYENAKKLISATAQDVLHPRPYHQGRPDDAISDFLSSCRFGQTEIGSYIVSVVCPFGYVDQNSNKYVQLSLFSEEKDCANSLTRKVTNRVMENLNSIRTSIDNGEPNHLMQQSISANFLEALQGMNLESEGTELEFSANWAPTVKNTAKIPQSVRISHDYYTPIQTISKALKSDEKQSTRIVGRIKKLESTPDLETREGGKITVVYLDDDDKAGTATAQLDRDDYAKAISAHENGQYVEIIGELSGSTHKEIKCKGFSVIS